MPGRDAAAAPERDAPGGDARRIAAAGGDELRRPRRHERDRDRARRRRPARVGLLDAPPRRTRRRPQRRPSRLSRRVRRHRHHGGRARPGHPGDRHDGACEGHGARARRRDAMSSAISCARARRARRCSSTRTTRSRACAGRSRPSALTGGRLKAIRIDSGDHDALARGARELLDAAGLIATQIILTGDLDAGRIGALRRGGRAGRTSSASARSCAGASRSAPSTSSSSSPRSPNRRCATR